jgi:hypothetical protein
MVVTIPPGNRSREHVRWVTKVTPKFRGSFGWARLESRATRK